MDNLKLDAICLRKCTLFRHQSGQRRQGSRRVGRCLTRVEPTIKVWSDVHGGSGLNSWFDLNCVCATKITAKPRSRWNLNLVQAWSTLVKRALNVLILQTRLQCVARTSMFWPPPVLWGACSEMMYNLVNSLLPGEVYIVYIMITAYAYR